MKTILLFSLLSLLIVISGISQITITSSNIVDIGDVVALANDTLPDASIVPGNSGAGQNWVFSTLAIHTQDSMKFTHPAWSPYDTSYTGDNIAGFFTDMNTWGYFNKTNSILENIGMVGDLWGNGTIMEVPFNPSETIMQFPFTYMDNFTDTSFMEIIMDTIKMEQTTNKIVEADAWGTLESPIGTYNVLRIRTYKIESQQLFKFISGSWVPYYSQSDTTIRYEWWSDDVSLRFPLVSFDWDSVANEAGEVEWLQNTFLAVENTIQDIEIDIYPNPCEEYLNIVANRINSVEVINMNGQVVLYSGMSDDQKSLNVGNLPKGLYMIRVCVDNEIIIRKQMIK